MKLREIARLVENEDSPLRGWFQRKSSTRSTDPTSRIHESTIMRWLEKCYARVLEIFRGELTTKHGMKPEEVEICMDLAIEDLAGGNIYQNLTASVIRKKPFSGTSTSARKVNIMANTQQNDTQNAKIQGLWPVISSCVQNRPMQISGMAISTRTRLNAFTEGTVSEREAWPIVNHLSDCNFCRHKTTELVRLDLEFADIDAPPMVRESSEPVSVSSVLSGILSRIFGSGEAAVFAHEEKKDDADEKDGRR